MQHRHTPSQNWLSSQPRNVMTVAAALAAFTAYTCMYAFRKPFTVGTYDGLTVLGADFKSVAVLFQIMGYLTSKFIGIKVVSEAGGKRALLMLVLIASSAVGLLLFAVLPAPWNIAGLFLNGLPLGMIWGLIFGFLEGRRVTEFLGLGLSLSVIFSSGWVKSAGKALMNAGVPEFWMPLATGALFVPLLLLAVSVLAALPPPDAEDRADRGLRAPMDAAARKDFLRRWWPGVVMLTGAYLCLMTYRDVRDSFMVDVLREQGHTVEASVFARLENIVGGLVIVCLVWLRWVRDHRQALLANAALVVCGPLIAALGTWMFQSGMIAAEAWLVVTGFGTYLAFVPFQSLLYDRLLAVIRQTATAAFLVAIADAYGYLSTVGIYASRFFKGMQMPWSEVLIQGSYVQAVLVALLTIGGVIYFLRAAANKA